MEMKHKNYNLKVFLAETGGIEMFGKHDEDERWEELSYNAPAQTLLVSLADVSHQLEISEKRVEKVKAELEAWTKCLPIDCGCDPHYCSCNAPSAAMSTVEEFQEAVQDMLDILEGKE